MKRIALFAFICIFTFIATGCKEKSEQTLIYEDITKKEAELYKNKTEAIDIEKGKEMVSLYASYAEKFPADTLAAEYLFRASEICENINQPNNAVRYLTQIEDNYKNYRNYPTCIFRKAYIYENQLKNIDKAREYYEKFTNDYPDHELAEAASSSLMLLGLSDEDLIKVIEQLSRK
ncbi:MAG: tetratricopeptide repeat protein [Bacteroidales bacterium]|nr:tetratricopeptide repeat protein [Bacteroidales bacterium]